MKKALLMLLALMLSAQIQAKPRAKARLKAKAAAKIAVTLDKDLLDFSVQPFSDQGSHFALKHLKQEGFTAWELSSAAAFGSQASASHAAKKLFNFRMELEVFKSDEVFFAKPVSDTADYEPRWVTEKAAQTGATAESGLAVPETDALVMAANFTNKSKKAIKVRPRLVISGGMDNFDTTAVLDQKSSVLSLTLDRSKLVQRKFKEEVCVMAGSGKSEARFSGGAVKSEDLSDVPQVSLGTFKLELGPKAYTTLKPGQTLRFPVALKIAPDEKQARLPMTRLWTLWASPKGEAISKAKARWAVNAAHLPKPADLKFERLSRRAAATLLMSQYARRSELKSDMFSQAKSYADAFFVDGLPMAALGMSELDHGSAESAVLEMTSFAAAAPDPVPPYTGEELLVWEAAGLPMHGWAGWELYQRDPELGRAGAFLAGMGVRLRNECAWWPAHRDGDGNCLYAYANEEEKPWDARATTVTGAVILQTYSVALSSFVAWQMQAAAALADAAGDTKESQGLMAESVKITQALKKEARDAKGVYVQGLDGYLPYLLGLDTDLASARSAMPGLLAQAAQTLPFAEKGVLNPSKAYLMLRTLALWGYQDEARAAAEKILAFLEDKPCFSAYDASGKGIGFPGDSATAGAILEIALERYTQEAYFLPDTSGLKGGMLSVKAPDGSFYLKRVGLSASKAVYSPLSLSMTADGFNLMAEKETRVSLSSKWPLQVTDLNAKQDIFKNTKRAAMILRAKTNYAIKIEKH